MHARSITTEKLCFSVSFVLRIGIFFIIFFFTETIYLILPLGEFTRRVVSLRLLCFSLLQWLTRVFKYETFRDQWIPLNSVWRSKYEVSMREQGQRRLQAVVGIAGSGTKPSPPLIAKSNHDLDAFIYPSCTLHMFHLVAHN